MVGLGVGVEVDVGSGAPTITIPLDELSIPGKIPMIFLKLPSTYLTFNLGTLESLL